jgi:hypothetical protein
MFRYDSLFCITADHDTYHTLFGITADGIIINGAECITSLAYMVCDESGKKFYAVPDGEEESHEIEFIDGQYVSVRVAEDMFKLDRRSDFIVWAETLLNSGLINAFGAEYIYDKTDKPECVYPSGSFVINEPSEYNLYAFDPTFSSELFTTPENDVESDCPEISPFEDKNPLYLSEFMEGDVLYFDVDTDSFYELKILNNYPLVAVRFRKDFRRYIASI